MPDACFAKFSNERSDFKISEQKLQMTEFKKQFPLHDAVASNDLERVKHILSSSPKGFDINARDHQGVSPF